MRITIWHAHIITHNGAMWKLRITQSHSCLIHLEWKPSCLYISMIYNWTTNICIVRAQCISDHISISLFSEYQNMSDCRWSDATFHHRTAACCSYKSIDFACQTRVRWHGRNCHCRCATSHAQQYDEHADNVHGTHRRRWHRAWALVLLYIAHIIKEDCDWGYIDAPTVVDSSIHPSQPNRRRRRLQSYVLYVVCRDVDLSSIASHRSFTTRRGIWSGIRRLVTSQMNKVIIDGLMALQQQTRETHAMYLLFDVAMAFNGGFGFVSEKGFLCSIHLGR